MRIPTQSLVLVHIVLLTIVVCQPACKSAKSLVANSKNASASKVKAGSAPFDICSQKVRFYSEKLLVVKTGQIMDVQTEITVDPSAKVVTLKAQAPGEEKAEFNTSIESFECHFNEDFTVGWALYNVDIKQQDGTHTKMILKLEAKDGMLQFVNGDLKEENQMTVYVSKWEVIDQQ